MISFEIYKRTQAELVRSRFVLVHAVRSLRKQQSDKNAHIPAEISEGRDPVAWLRERLSVNFPGNAEIMQVSVACTDPKEAQTLVNAVADAYKTAVVDAEADLQRARYAELDRACVEKEQDIRNRRQELRNLTTEVGSVDSDTLRERQKLAFDEVRMLWRQLGPLQTDLRVFKRDLAVQKALLPDAKGDRVAILKDIKRLETAIGVMTEQQAELEDKVKYAREEAVRFGRSTVDSEMLRAEIRDQKAVLSVLTSQRETMKIKLRAAPRIQLLERAEEGTRQAQIRR